MHDTASTHLSRVAQRTRSRTRPPAPGLLAAVQPASVPGHCGVVPVRAGDLTDAHVIRLAAGQGIIWHERQSRPAARTVDVRRTWREVLGVYTDRDRLEAEFGQCWPGCTHDGCQARLQDDGWHSWGGAGTAGAHEHQPRHRPGQLDGEMASLADRVWEESESSILIRVLIHELSDPGEIADAWVILNRVDLLDAQSLPAPCRREWGLAAGLTPAMMNLLVGAAGGLWNSTGGADPFDVLDRSEREMLDLAAARYRADAAEASR